MKTINIIALANAGILSITANNLDAAHAYKVLKFKKAVRKAFENIMEAEQEILKEAGIKDPNAFDKEREELRNNGSNPERLAELDAQFTRLVELRNSLYEEDAKLDGCLTIPFEQFHILQRENKELPGKPLNAHEDILEGVLWSEPEESE